MTNFRLDLIKNDKENSFEGVIDDKSKIVVFYDAFKDGTSVLLHNGTSLRKVTILNVRNESEAIRDALASVRTFVKASAGLSKAQQSFQKKLWPTLDGEVLAPTFENVSVEKLNLSMRAENALEKNKITILKEIPTKLETIEKLSGVGKPTAKEIFTQRKKFLAVVGKTSLPSKPSPKLIVDSEIPKNLQEILKCNALAFLSDIPRDISKLMKLKKMGPAKAHQLLTILEKS